MMTASTPDATGISVDPGEIARFTDVADEWWDSKGKFAPLHRLNPLRLRYIRDRAAAHFGRNAAEIGTFSGLSLVDIGCGGGLVAEPMARLGFTVTGIDAGARSLDVARGHATAGDLKIDYRAITAESLADSGATFDVVLALEIIEHVADLEAFFGALGRLMRPGGLVIVSTINRTLKSLMLVKIGAEYILRWVPAGTHDWQKFRRPSETAHDLRRAGLTVKDLSGMVLNPLSGEWSLARDLDANYIATAISL